MAARAIPQVLIDIARAVHSGDPVAIGISIVGLVPVFGKGLKIAYKVTKRAAKAAKNAGRSLARKSASTIAKCRGPQCDVCFVAGTLVLGASGPLSIERIVAGDRVQTYEGGTTEWAEKDWRRVHLTVPDERDADHLYQVVRLMTVTDLRQHQVAKAGDTLSLSMPELGLRGVGTITLIETGDVVADGPGRVVMATVSHLNSDVYEVGFVEGGEALRGTGAHPLYSVDRDDWVRIRDLQVGERLQTAEGAVTVEALEKVRGVHRVYNLEVEGDHEYLVGEAGVRAHNTCTFANQLAGSYADEVADAARAGVSPMRAGAAGFDDLVNEGPIKWVVTESGELVVGPHTRNGIEISHAVLSGGAPVRAAGQANIAAAGGSRVGLEITNHSGHFKPSAESLQIGKDAFRALGISF